MGGREGSEGHSANLPSGPKLEGGGWEDALKPQFFPCCVTLCQPRPLSEPQFPQMRNVGHGRKRRETQRMNFLSVHGRQAEPAHCSGKETEAQSG